MRLVLNWTKHPSHEGSHPQHTKPHFAALSGLEALVGGATTVTTNPREGLGDLQILLGGDLQVSFITFHHRHRFAESFHQRGIIGGTIQIRLGVGATQQFDLEELWRLHPVESRSRKRLLHLASADLMTRRRCLLLLICATEDVSSRIVVVETEDRVDRRITLGGLEDLFAASFERVPQRNSGDHRRTRPSRFEHPRHEFIVDQGSRPIVDRDVGASFGHRIQGSKHRLPSLSPPTFHDRATEEPQLGSIPISKGFKVVGRSGDDDGIDFVPFGEGFDRAKQYRTTTEVGSELVTRAKAMSGSCGGNDDGDSHA